MGPWARLWLGLAGWLWLGVAGWLWLGLVGWLWFGLAWAQLALVPVVQGPGPRPWAQQMGPRAQYIPVIVIRDFYMISPKTRFPATPCENT